jgi:hypothetical protein
MLNDIILKKFERHCPECNVIISYKHVESLNRAILKKSVCKKCYYGRPEQSGPFLRKCPVCEKTIEYSRNDTRFYAEKKKVSCNSCGQKKRIISDDFCKKQAEIYKNSTTEMKIKRMGMLGKKHTIETRQKMSNSAKLYITSCKSHNLKVRVDKGQLELLEKWNRLGFNFEPNYKLNFENFSYFIDGYDAKKNIVFEYDAPYHFKGIKQRMKDEIRQSAIIQKLNPRAFWRYNSVEKKFNNVMGGKK